MTVVFRAFETEWGHAGAAWSELGACKVVLPMRSEALARKALLSDFPGAIEDGGGGLDDLCEQLRDYFGGIRTGFETRIDLSWATPFQLKVYNVLMKIPFGETWSYGQVAASAGCKGGARAVGAANSRNRLPLVIPCHRVIKSDGGLGGFSAPEGPKLKEKLLDHEATCIGPR